MKETFYSQNCNDNMDKGVLNSLNDVNRGYCFKYKPLELPCNLKLI